MIRKDLLEILRCPVCVKNGAGSLRNYKESYLICGDCGRKYNYQIGRASCRERV